MSRAISPRRVIASVGVIVGVASLVASQILTVQASTTIRVAARGFTEDQISGYLFSQLLSAHGFNTTINTSFGSESSIFSALSSGNVDVVPDYLGNGLVDLGQVYTPGTSPQKVLKNVNSS